jgi:hypothetical protein
MIRLRTGSGIGGWSCFFISGNDKCLWASSHDDIFKQ